MIINKYTPETVYSCGCIIWKENKGEYSIEYCPTHKAAPELVEVLKEIASFLYGYSENERLVSSRGSRYPRFKELYTKAYKALKKAGEEG